MSYTGTAADRLAAVRAAIDNCLASQSMSGPAGTQTMAQLRDLRQMERELVQEAAYEQNGGGMASLGIQTRPR